MKKKIIDITPPGEEISERIKKEKKKKNFNFSFSRSLLLTLIAFILIIVIGLLAVPLYSKMTVLLYPKIRTNNSETEVKISSSQSKIDLMAKIIPAKIYKKNVSFRKTFKATGEKNIGKKASGIIRVYNSTKSLRQVVLKEKTRFLSSDGAKIFRAVSKIYIPAAKKNGSKIIPGSVNIKVVAQEEGEEYNIKPSKFSVPGLMGSSLYYTIWGESTEAMSGGFKKTVKVVSSDDIEKAKSELKKALLEKSSGLVKKELGNQKNLIIDSQISKIDNLKFSCSKKEADQADNFNCQASADVSFLIFNLDDLRKIAEKYLRDNLPSMVMYDKKSLALNYSPENLLNESGKVVLDLKIQVNTYNKISNDLILSQVEGKRVEKAKNIIFYNYPQVEKVKFIYKPFWAAINSKLPKSEKRIKIEVIPE